MAKKGKDMKPLDCRGEVNPPEADKIDIADNRKNEVLKELLKQISRMGKKRKQRS